MWTAAVGSSARFVETMPGFPFAIEFTPGGDVVVGLDDGSLHLLPGTPSSGTPSDGAPDFFPSPNAETIGMAFGDPDDVTMLMSTAHTNGSVMLWEVDLEVDAAFLIDEFEGAPGRGVGCSDQPGRLVARVVGLERRPHLAADRAARCAEYPSGEGAPEDAPVWEFSYSGDVD